MIMATRLVVLISGNGSNLQAIIDAIASGVLHDTAISLVISNRKHAYGLQRARDADIETAYHNLIPYQERFSDSDTRCGRQAREAYDADLAEIVLGAKPTMVICAGW
jgi:phosphoribosylglycinamide formyltransferase